MAVKTEKIQYNQLPRPTFRWMKVNHLELDPLNRPLQASNYP